MAATLLGRFTIKKYGDSRFHGLYDGDTLICVTVYKKGAKEVERRLIGYELAILGISPEQERELLLEEIEKIIRDGKGFPEPCDLYDKCWECPNFKDCFEIQAIPGEVGAKL